MKIGFLLFLLALMAIPSGLLAQRETVSLNGTWKFRFAHIVDKKITQDVTVPHTWNAVDALNAKADYFRGIGNYWRNVPISKEWEGKRLFLRFEGVNSVADVFVNGKHIGNHKGGYSTFILEITDRVKYGEDNEILVRAANSERLDVLPLVGDFNKFGGIYRDVDLMVLDRTCISPLDYGSPGVYLRQHDVSEKKANVDCKVLISSIDKDKDVTVDVNISGPSGTVAKKSMKTKVKSGQTEVNIPLTINNPHLWNGCEDPFLYEAEIVLTSEGKTIDAIKQPLGLRYFSIDPDKGFFLNGKHLALHGVCRHQDKAEKGNALLDSDQAEDIAIMRQMGVNAVRLSHYQHNQYFYDLLDKTGIIAWTEIPFVGPGGYADKGYVDMEEFKDNARQQLKELIRQNYNHPSVCFWGMFNELNLRGDNPTEFIKELSDLAHAEDDTRPTTAATNTEGELNYQTDLIAWNRYDGWYGSTPSTLAKFLDKKHSEIPQKCIGISEYGAGASINHQTDELKQPVPTGRWHPENWQLYYHMKSWEILNSRPFIWGTFIWNMFDFAAAHRTEGENLGYNDKGLVTYDRKVKKDAFYYYKANWNPEPMAYIAGKRNMVRSSETQDIIVFTNLDKAVCRVNGEVQAELNPDEYHVAEFKNIKLHKGNNIIEITTPDPKVYDKTEIIIE